MDVTVTSSENIDNDVLVVNGTVDGTEVVATGWQSALTNYYPPSAYVTGNDGIVRLNPKVKPRSMTSDEETAYCQTLLISANPITP